MKWGGGSSEPDHSRLTGDAGRQDVARVIVENMIFVIVNPSSVFGAAGQAAKTRWYTGNRASPAK